METSADTDQNQGQGQGQSQGFTWTGSLETQDLAAIYARCAAVRLSGRLVLEDDGRVATVEFIAGEPVSLDAPDPSDSEWKRGNFVLAQAAPDLRGELTEGVELEGSLAITRPKMIINHCQDSLLSADVYFWREGDEQARVRFAHGRVEHAEVHGRPDMGALTKLDKWPDGKYRLVLRPLFGAEAPTPPPAIAPPKLLPDEKSFDLTGQAPLVPRRPQDEIDRTPPPDESSEELFEEDMHSIETMRPRVAGLGPVSGEERPMPSESTAITRGTPLPAERPAPSGGGGKRIALVAGLVAVFGGIALGAWFLLAPRIPEQDGPGQGKVTVTPAPPGKPEPGKTGEPAAKSPDEKGEAPGKVEKTEKPAPAPAPEAVKPKAAPPVAAADPEVAKLVAKGLKLLVTNHAHSASDNFKKALKRAPGDAAIEQYLAMALGKTGRGELVLEGKGSVLIHGEKFRAPKKVKLPAGTYPVELKGGKEEVVVRKGEKAKLQVR